MNRLSTHRTATATILALAAATLGALAACADSETSARFDEPTHTDSGATTALPDAAPAPEDAGADAAEASAPKDAQTDGPTRLCSDDNFCHSALPGSHVLRGVWGDGTGIVWAVSSEGSVLRWDGNAWSEHTSGLQALSSIWGSGASDIWLLATDGTVYHGAGPSSSALVFSPVALPGDQSVPIKCLWGSGPDDIWAVGGKQDMFEYPYPATGRALHYTLAAGWTVDDELSAQPIAYENVWGTPASGLWLQGKVEADEFGWLSAPVIRRTAGSSTWVRFELPPDPEADFGAKAETIGNVAVMPGGNTIWAVGRTATRRALWRGHTSDNGQTFGWTFIPLLAWEPQVNAFWGTAPNDVWAVGEPGRVARWNGTKWQQAAIRVEDTPVTTAFHAIWGTRSDDFWVVGDNAALHRTSGTKP